MPCDYDEETTSGLVDAMVARVLAKHPLNPEYTLSSTLASLFDAPPVLSVSPDVRNNTTLIAHSQVPLYPSTCPPTSLVSLFPVSSCLPSCEPVAFLFSISASTSTHNFLFRLLPYPGLIQNRPGFMSHTHAHHCRPASAAASSRPAPAAASSHPASAGSSSHPASASALSCRCSLSDATETADVPQGALVPEGVPEGAPVPEGVPEGAPIPEGIPEGASIPEGAPKSAPIPEGIPKGAPIPICIPEGAPVPENIVTEEDPATWFLFQRPQRRPFFVPEATKEAFFGRRSLSPRPVPAIWGAHLALQSHALGVGDGGVQSHALADLSQTLRPSPPDFSASRAVQNLCIADSLRLSMLRSLGTFLVCFFVCFFPICKSISAGFRLVNAHSRCAGCALVCLVPVGQVLLVLHFLVLWVLTCSPSLSLPLLDSHAQQCGLTFLCSFSLFWSLVPLLSAVSLSTCCSRVPVSSLSRVLSLASPFSPLPCLSRTLSCSLFLSLSPLLIPVLFLPS